MRSDHATPNEPNKNNASQENTMAKAIQKQSASGGTIELRPVALPEGYIPMPQMTDEEIDAELARTGETREQILAEFQDLGARLRAKFLPQPKPAPIIDLPIDDCPKMDSICFFEDRVAAGFPQWNNGAGQGRALSLVDLFGKQDWENVFTIKVSGWSMTNDHITDGDIVLVDKSIEPKDGDIVVAFLPGEGQVVKRLRVFPNKIVLESAHPDFKAIDIEDPSSLVIQGVVRGRSGPI